MGILLAIQGAVSQGVLWSIMALGVYITFRVIDIPDLTVDGSFALGGAVCAAMITKGMNPWETLLIATIAGVIAGMVTGFFYTKCGIPAILAGILTQIGLYSINLRIMGRSNTPLLKQRTIYKDVMEMTGFNLNWIILGVGVVFAVVIVCALYWFFGTEVGSAIRATGNNEHMVRSLGMNTNTTKTLGLMIGNGLIGLAGALVTQSQGYADVKMGTGAIVIGLASIIIGEVVFGLKHSFMVKLFSIAAGSVIYRIIVAVVLQMGLNTDDLKLLTALLVATALSLPVMMEHRKQKQRYRVSTEKGDQHAGN